MSDDDLLLAMHDPVPGVREHGVLLAEPRLNDTPALRERVLVLADDGDVRVRFQVAFTLGEVQDDRGRSGAGGHRSPRCRQSLDADRRAQLQQPLRRSDAGRCPGRGRFRRAAASGAFRAQLATVIGGRGKPQQIQAICSRLASCPPRRGNRALERGVILGLGDGLKRSRRGFEWPCRAVRPRPRRWSIG